MPLVSPRLWLRRVLFWCGAVLVALVAIGFARAADGAQAVSRAMAPAALWWPCIFAAPAGDRRSG